LSFRIFLKGTLPRNGFPPPAAQNMDGQKWGGAFKQKKKIVNNKCLISFNGSACGAFFFLKKTSFFSFFCKKSKIDPKKKYELLKSGSRNGFLDKTANWKRLGVSWHCH